MLIEHEVIVSAPIETLERVVIDRFRSAEILGESIYRHGEQLRSKVGPDGPVAKEVVLNLGHPRIINNGLSIPITWRATGAGLLFPRLTGDIEIRRTSLHHSIMRIQATYDPPFGWIGDVLDRLLLERVARLTVVGWMNRVAADLDSEFGTEVVPAADRDRDLDHGAHTNK